MKTVNISGCALDIDSHSKKEIGGVYDIFYNSQKLES
jgi:hypothetical protein